MIPLLSLCVLAIFICTYFVTTRRPKYTATGHAEITVQDYGTITIDLCGKEAPKTVDHFISLAESGFYDGLTFYRVIDGFMIQGGDPDEAGGNSTDASAGELTVSSAEGRLSHLRGAVAAAHGVDDDHPLSQFFIVQEDSTYLDGSYAVFGYVTSGMDVVDEICADAMPIDHNGTLSQNEQPVIISVRIYN
ncbi:MAG: peptidylprolyl isomerase [Oscillospiraceae bacterium]